MARTVQRTQVVPKAQDEMDLGLTIECVNCHTYRTFKITTHLEAIMDEQLKSYGVIIECEECGHLIDVAIGWYRYPGRGHPESARVQVGRGPGFQQVQDPIGLTRST